MLWVVGGEGESERARSRRVPKHQPSQLPRAALPATAPPRPPAPASTPQSHQDKLWARMAASVGRLRRGRPVGWRAPARRLRLAAACLGAHCRRLRLASPRHTRTHTATTLTHVVIQGAQPGGAVQRRERHRFRSHWRGFFSPAGVTHTTGLRPATGCPPGVEKFACVPELGETSSSRLGWLGSRAVFVALLVMSLDTLSRRFFVLALSFQSLLPAHNQTHHGQPPARLGGPLPVEHEAPGRHEADGGQRDERGGQEVVSWVCVCGAVWRVLTIVVCGACCQSVPCCCRRVDGAQTAQAGANAPHAPGAFH